MKTPFRVCLALLLCDLSAHAAVLVSPGRIEVHGTLEGDQFMGTSIGETLDYLTFEVTTRTTVRLIGIQLENGPVFLAVAHVYDPDQQFENAAGAYRIFAGDPPVLTLTLDPNLYAIQVAVEEFRGGDLAETFIPVLNTEAILSTVAYSFVLEGDVRGLQFLEGNRDRTFTVTQIVPEPTAATLLLAAAAATALRRRRR